MAANLLSCRLVGVCARRADVCAGRADVLPFLRGVLVERGSWCCREVRKSCDDGVVGCIGAFHRVRFLDFSLPVVVVFALL